MKVWLTPIEASSTRHVGMGERAGARFIPIRAWNYLVVAALMVVVWLAADSFRVDGLRLVRDSWGEAGPPTEFLQDLIGARALLEGTDPNPVLEQAAARLDIEWSIAHASTHPPTAFLLALPLSGLPWELATRWWMAAMVSLLGLTAVALGLRRAALPTVAVALLWPPTAWSLFQLTPIWLAGLALAWRLQSRPLLAGMVIGVASLTKLLPALALAPFLWRRQWPAAIGFTGVWATALAVLALLGASDALWQYLVLMVQVGSDQAARSDNAALLVAAWARWGWLGLTLAGILIAGVLGQVATCLRAGTDRDFASYGLWVWLTVALLPIAWDYSLLPLLPWLAIVVWRGRPLAAALAGTALALPMIPWAEDNSLLITLAIAAAGLALANQIATASAVPREISVPTALVKPTP